MLCRPGIVAAQNGRLDRFQVKAQLAQASADIQDGRILASMALDRQAAALRNAIAQPLVRARDLLTKDIREHDEQLDGDSRCAQCK